MRHHGRKNLLSIILGSIAASVSLYFLVTRRTDLTIVAASIFFCLVCITDSLYGKVPNLLNGCLIVAGFFLCVYSRGPAGALFSLSGLALGIVLLLLPYLMGGFGAGDVKALGALGALIGPYDLLHVFVYMAFFGGGLALLFNLYNLLRTDFWIKLRTGLYSVRAYALTGDFRNLGPGDTNKPRRLVRFPYATAIAFGYYTFITRGGVL